MLPGTRQALILTGLERSVHQFAQPAEEPADVGTYTLTDWRDASQTIAELRLREVEPLSRTHLCGSASGRQPINRQQSRWEVFRSFERPGCRGRQHTTKMFTSRSFSTSTAVGFDSCSIATTPAGLRRLEDRSSRHGRQIDAWGIEGTSGSELRSHASYVTLIRPMIEVT